MDGPGRPSHYKPEFAEQAFELCLAGATNRDLAETFEVGHSTIDNWLHKHPEFAQAVRRGRAPGRRQGGARPLCPRHRLQLRDHPGRALQGRAGGPAADGAQAARRQGRHLLAAQPPARAVARLRAGAPRRRVRRRAGARSIARAGPGPATPRPWCRCGKAMRGRLRARPCRMMAEARWAVIRKGMGKGALAVMRLTTKPGQTTLTPMPSFFST